MVNVRDLSIAGNIKIRKMLLGASFALFLFLYGLVGVEFPLHSFFPKAEAQTPQKELAGWAWSETIGWISFNCKDTNTCGTGTGKSNYKVLYNESTGLLNGYAWSEHIGWVKFGGLSDFPAYTNNQNGNAGIAGPGELYGWARACAGTENGDCSTMGSRTDGWDGWISIASDDRSYGPTLFADNKIDGFSWGSDVVGWIDWDPETNPNGTINTNCTNCGVHVETPFDFALGVTTPITIQKGASKTISAHVIKIAGTNSEDVTLTHSNNSNLDVSIPDPVCNPHSSDPFAEPQIEDCYIQITINVHANAVYGNHTIVLTGTSQSNTVRNQDLTINVPPPVFSGTLTCTTDKAFAFINQDITWTARATGGSGNYNFDWTGDVTGNTDVVIKSFATAGIKTATVRLTDGDSSAEKTCSVNINVRKKSTNAEI